MAFMISGLPIKARPVIFLIDVAEGKDAACNFLWNLLNKLKALQKHREILMVSIILYSHNTHFLKIYLDSVQKDSINDYTQKYKFVEFLSIINESCLPIYNANNIKETGLRFFFNQYVYEQQSIALNNTDYLKPVFDVADRIMFFLPENWINTCLVIIDNSLTQKKMKQINKFKMDSIHMTRLCTSKINNDIKRIGFLAEEILQYVEPKPIPRVKKKSVVDCLAVQIPVLEGAMYDNE